MNFHAFIKDQAVEYKFIKNDEMLGKVTVTPPHVLLVNG